MVLVTLHEDGVGLESTWADKMATMMVMRKLMFWNCIREDERGLRGSNTSAVRSSECSE
jgi:hypothetical protein